MRNEIGSLFVQPFVCGSCVVVAVVPPNACAYPLAQFFFLSFGEGVAGSCYPLSCIVTASSCGVPMTDWDTNNQGAIDCQQAFIHFPGHQNVFLEILHVALVLVSVT